MRQFKVFKPTEEQMSSYKPYSENSYITDTYYQRFQEIDILTQCMSNREKTTTLIDDLCSKIKLYEFAVRETARHNVYSWYKNSDDGTIEIPYDIPMSNEEMIDTMYDIVEDLVLFTKAIKRDDYFDQNSNFFEIKSEIKGKLEYLREIFYDDEVNKITESLKDCEICDDKLN